MRRPLADDLAAARGKQPSGKPPPPGKLGFLRVALTWLVGLALVAYVGAAMVAFGVVRLGVFLLVALVLLVVAGLEAALKG